MEPKVYFTIYVLVILFNILNALPTPKTELSDQEKSCKEVCGICECEGYYCGDECICECNLTTDEKLDCIMDMKKECTKNGLEYELILQESKPRKLRDVESNINEDLLNQFRNWQKRGTENTTPTSTTGKPQNDSTLAQAFMNPLGQPIFQTNLNDLISKLNIEQFPTLSSINLEGLNTDVIQQRIDDFVGASLPVVQPINSLPSLPSLPFLPQSLPSLNMPSFRTPLTPITFPHFTPRSFTVRPFNFFATQPKPATDN